MKSILIALSLIPLMTFAAPIKFESQTVIFSPTNTAEVGRAFLSVRCLREAWAWEDFVNVAKTLACSGFKVNGASLSKYNSEKAIEMKKIGPNQFLLNKVDVEFSTMMKGHACFRVITTLEAGKFENAIDQWSLLGYCSVSKLPFPNDLEIFENRRVKSLNEFKNALNNPIEIKTKL